MNKAENEIRYKTDRERGIIIDGDGNILVDKLGEKHSVAFNKVEREKMPGTILTHNHPSGGGFSGADLEFAVSNQLKEIRAVGKNYKHSLRFKPENIPGEDLTVKTLNVGAEHYSIDNQVRQEFWEKINNGQLSFAEAEAEHAHEVLRRMTENETSKDWMIYKRQKWKTND